MKLHVSNNVRRTADCVCTLRYPKYIMLNRSSQYAINVIKTVISSSFNFPALFLDFNPSAYCDDYTSLLYFSSKRNVLVFFDSGQNGASPEVSRRVPNEVCF